MKSLVITIIFFFVSLISFCQTDDEIGSVYVKRAEQSYLDNEMDMARESFDKAITYIKIIKTSRVARIGTLLSFNIKDYTKAKILAKRYFELEKDKTTEEYQEMLEIIVSINEALESRAIEEERKRVAKIEQQKEEKRLDSLTSLWLEKSQKFYVDVDSVGHFNRYNLAIYKSKQNLGLIDDFGNIVVQADSYQYVLQQDGYFLFMNNIDMPSRIFSYNANTKESYLLPDVSKFNPQAYNYGKLMLPRRNGILVTYPETISDIVVFDLNTRKFIKNKNIDDKKELLKALKKDDIIEKYDKDLNIRIEKLWYSIGSSLGANFYPLFSDNKTLYGFLNVADGRLYTTNYYSNFGVFCDNIFQVIEQNGNTIWLDAQGLKKDNDIMQKSLYSGSTKFVKTSDGRYQILFNKDGKEVLVLGKETLNKLEDFIEIHAK